MDNSEFLHTVREYNGLRLVDTVDYNKFTYTQSLPILPLLKALQ